MAGQVPLIASFIASIAALACLIASTAFSEWYVVTVAGEPFFTVGLWEYCALDGTCDDMNGDNIDMTQVSRIDETTAVCHRDPERIDDYLNGIRGLLVVSILFCFAAGSMGIFAKTRKEVRPWVRNLTLLLPIFTSLMAGIGLALWAYFIDNWLFCDTNFCDMRQLNDPQKCTNEFGFGFVIGACALILVFVGTIAAAFFVRLADEPLPSEEESCDGNGVKREMGSQKQQPQTVPVVEPRSTPYESAGGRFTIQQQRGGTSRQEESLATQQQQEGGLTTTTGLNRMPMVVSPPTVPRPAEAAEVKVQPQQQEQQQQREEDRPTGMPLPPSGGDWVWDEESELYWSETHFLYLDTMTNQYYDPDSEQWYDPVSKQWYTVDA